MPLLPGRDEIKGRLKTLPLQSVHEEGVCDKTGLKRILIQAVERTRIEIFTWCGQEWVFSLPVSILIVLWQGLYLWVQEVWLNVGSLFVLSFPLPVSLICCDRTLCGHLTMKQHHWDLWHWGEWHHTWLNRPVLTSVAEADQSFVHLELMWCVLGDDVNKRPNCSAPVRQCVLRAGAPWQRLTEAFLWSHDCSQTWVGVSRFDLYQPVRHKLINRIYSGLEIGWLPPRTSGNVFDPSVNRLWICDFVQHHVKQELAPETFCQTVSRLSNDDVIVNKK